MGLVKVKEETGGAQFEVIEVTTPNQLVELGELEEGSVVYNPETKERVDSNTVMKPGESFATTVAAEFGS